MKINISFGKVWSIPEVKAFIADPQSPVFSALDKDAYLELDVVNAPYDYKLAIRF
jgi:hypothetical protein